MDNDIWLIGAGQMAIDYSKVLIDLGVSFTVIGRSEQSCKDFFEKTGKAAIPGGLNNYLKSKPEIPEAVIVAVNVENLAESCEILIRFGVMKILLEKPGVGYAHEIISLSELVLETNSNVLLAYNRRFYTSILAAQEIIKIDGGVKSFHFEFTEWSHQIKNLKKHKTELENWFLGNSTHIIDAAFYLGGEPDKICCFYKGGLEWHSKSSIYSGAGVSKNGALFSYIANWEGPGRWNMEIITSKRRLIFKPLEKLQIMEIGSVEQNFVENVDYSIDENFKPGLYLQTKAFLQDEWVNFINIQDQAKRMNLFQKMSGY
jgi:predicted dehydrogenase